MNYKNPIAPAAAMIFKKALLYPNGDFKSC